MKRTKISIPQRKPREPRRLACDLVMELEHNQVTNYDIRAIMSTLHQWDDWGFIMPRRHTDAIKLPFELAELPLTSTRTEDIQAQAIYRTHDAVMVKRATPP